MQKATPQQHKHTLLLFSIALLVAAADQLSKAWIKSILAIGQSLPETGFFRLAHTTNTGAAFGIFHGQNLPLAIIAATGIVLILLYVFVFYQRYPVLGSNWSWAALGLILGGTAGNLIDRIVQGYVTDFISVGPWPNFNIADSSTVVGVIILAITLLLLAKTGE